MVSEPNFVSSFELDNFIYFFFREIAIEFINCGKVCVDAIRKNFVSCILEYLIFLLTILKRFLPHRKFTLQLLESVR